MKRKINKQSLCERVLEWSLEHRKESLPAILQEHCSHCVDCQAFLEQERWITDTIQNQAKQAPTGLSPERFSRVYEAIRETSERLSVPVKRGFVWRRVVVSALTACVMAVTGFWFLPLFHGETFIASKMNQQMRTLLHYKAPVMDSVSIAQAEQTLQFASQYYNTNEEKTFYYANDHYSYEELLWIRWLVKRTRVQYDTIAEDYQTLSPAKLLKKYHIPSREALPALESILNQYRQSVASADITVDGVIERVDYYTQQIWLDSLPYPLYTDNDLINFAKIHSFVQMKLQKQGQQWNVIQIADSGFCNTILKGVLVSASATNLVLQDNPVVIEWNNRTIYSTCQPKELINKPVQIRAIPDKGKSIALTIHELQEPKLRTLTGLIDTAYQTGFTMKDIHQSFLLSSHLKNNPREIDKSFQVSITGEDYGEYFIVTEFTLIAPPVENTDILLASAEPVIQASSRQKEATTTRKAASSLSPVKTTWTFDWIVGIKNNQYLLASGTTISKASYTIPIGSKITKTVDSKTQTTIQSNQINGMAVHQIQATLTGILSNGIYEFQSDGKKRVLYFTDKALPYINQKVRIQGQGIEYPELIILIDARVFQSQNAKILKGLIIREMERGKIFLLDNGTIFRVDSLTAVQNGPVAVGKTVKLTGVDEHNTFTAFIVEVQREFAIFTGKIIEINHVEKWCRMDSGKQFYWTTEAQFSMILQALDSGNIVYCKAFYENQQWMIEDLTFTQGETGDQA
ncbi:hypothetical protein LLG10_07740 [bacterium]|nr:hypothetical protein [bacterium]